MRVNANASFRPNPFGSSVANVTTFDVTVGRHGSKFEPPIIRAAVGDVINFHFYPLNHSVAEATFRKPCQPKTGGVDDPPIFSGFFPVQDGVINPDMFSMRINKTDPIWLYSAQTENNPCKAGQVMVINPHKNSNDTLEAFMVAAAATNTTKSPEKFHGGILVKDTTHLFNSSTGPASASSTQKSGSTTRFSRSLKGWIWSAIFLDATLFAFV